MKEWLFVLWISVASVIASTAAAGGMEAWRGLPTSVLNTNERATLVFMREEEKLARDVYRKMYAAWGRLVFANIAESEQRHMDAIAQLLSKYRVSDPVQDDSTGAFEDASLSRLYKELIDDGQESVVTALEVGAYIEEIDILDLEEGIAQTDNVDIRKVYGNLLKGSRNHLRAFVRNLETLGIVYEPKDLDLQTFEAIVFGHAER